MGDADPMYSTAQIAIPATLPEILKRYTKAAIKTQPDDLLQWSALYFEALAEGNPPPVSNRVVGKQTTVKDIKADAKPQEPVATAPPAEQQHDNSAQEPAATTNSPTSNTDTQADSATSEPLALDGALAQFAAHALHAGKIMSRAEAMKLASDTGISHKLIEDAMFMVGKDNRVSGPGITLILAGFFIPSSDDAFARLATLYDKDGGSLPTDIFVDAYRAYAGAANTPAADRDAVLQAAQAQGDSLTKNALKDVLAAHPAADADQPSGLFSTCVF